MYYNWYVLHQIDPDGLPRSPLLILYPVPRLFRLNENSTAECSIRIANSDLLKQLPYSH